MISLYGVYQRARNHNQRHGRSVVWLVAGGISTNDDAINLAAALQKNLAIGC
jgi:hypothetical protein